MNLDILLNQYRRGERPLPGYDELTQVVEAGDIHTLTNEIVAWADSVFPDRQPSSALLKLFEETGELVRDPSSANEYADICIMIFDLANMHGVDLAHAIREKLKINRTRTWGRTPTGTFQHNAQNNQFPDCWVVVKDGKILGTNDEPFHFDGVEAVKYSPPTEQPLIEKNHGKNAEWIGYTDWTTGEEYGENIDPNWSQELRDQYSRGWHMGLEETTANMPNGDLSIEDHFRSDFEIAKNAYLVGYTDWSKGKSYGESAESEWGQELRDWYGRGWNMGQGENRN